MTTPSSARYVHCKRSVWRLCRIYCLVKPMRVGSSLQKQSCTGYIRMASHVGPSFLQHQTFFMFAQTPSSELRSRTQVGSWMTVSQSGCAPVNSPTTRHRPDLCRSDRGRIGPDPGQFRAHPSHRVFGRRPSFSGVRTVPLGPGQDRHHQEQAPQLHVGHRTCPASSSAAATTPTASRSPATRPSGIQPRHHPHRPTSFWPAPQHDRNR